MGSGGGGRGRGGRGWCCGWGVRRLLLSVWWGLRWEGVGVGVAVQVSVYLREDCAIADGACKTSRRWNGLAVVHSALQEFYNPSLPRCYNV